MSTELAPLSMSLRELKKIAEGTDPSGHLYADEARAILVELARLRRAANEEAA